MFRMAAGEGKAVSKMEQACSPTNHSAAQHNSGSPFTAATNPLCLTNLQTVASDKKVAMSAALVTAITELKADIHSIAGQMGMMEQAVSRQSDVIRQVQRTSDSNLCYILEIHRHLEDIDN